MNANTMLAETVALLKTLSYRAALPGPEPGELDRFAGEVEKISGQLATAEDMLALTGHGVEG
jgi:hypothetical protein